MPITRRVLSLPAVLLVALAACQSPAGTAPPTGQPGGTPAASPTTGSPRPSIADVDYPTEANVVVLRMEEVGGFVPMEYNAIRLPQFSLYGDGTVVFQEAPSPFAPGTAGTPLRTAQMTPDQVATLLAFALGPSGLQDAREHYPNPLLADAATTVFTINAGGVRKQVAIDGLEEGNDVTAPQDIPERRAFGRLKTTLATFAEAVSSGEVSDGGSYEPPAYRGILVEAGGIAGEPRDWPWDDLAPDDFVMADDFNFRTAVLTPEQAAELVDDPRGGVLGISVTGPDRAPYTLNLRPLLPDETS